MSTRLGFLGAARTVTGSRFLVDSGRARLLVDAGMFQGPHDLRERNWEPFPVPPDTLDAVVVTHAHLDHTGYLPVLAREGFRGPVYCTSETAALATVVLRDAAHLQEEEAEWARESGMSKHAEPRPLFDSGDVSDVLALLHPVPFHARFQAAPGVHVELLRAGHILGSSVVRLAVDGVGVGFSGDLGRPDHPLLVPPDPAPEVDHLVIESTYGDRSHDLDARNRLAAVLRRVLGRGGTVLMPAFAVDRTALLLHELQTLVRAGQVPDVPVYVDSPMALAALDIYRHARVSDLGTSDFRPELLGDDDPFDPGRLHLVPRAGDSALLNDTDEPCIVISASGMATGGRVLHHLEHQLPEARNAVVLTGYQVAGTRGRALAEGATALKIHGRYVPVRAEVADVRGYSVHADAEQLLAWLKTAQEPSTVYVVHGEQDAATAFAGAVHERLGWNAVVPRYREKVRLD
jgi:metallo-beta-lactamase family protein